MMTLDEPTKLIFNRLEMRGMQKNEIAGFLWSLKSCLLDNPDMDYAQAKERLKFLGWSNFELDYHTLQLAITCFERGGFNRANRLLGSMQA